jgi:hypothetical protein
MRVALYDGGRNDYAAEIVRSFAVAVDGLMSADATNEAARLLAVAARYPVGAVLEWRLGKWRERAVDPAGVDATTDESSPERQAEHPVDRLAGPAPDGGTAGAGEKGMGV